jgi:arylsulfatase A-like enzyme
MYTRYLSILTAILLAHPLSAANNQNETTAGASAKPNIILLVADDMGYAEIGPQGGDVPSPHIDSLAKDGVRFSNGYVSGPVCSPTRAGLLTGRYQQRFGHEFNPGMPSAVNVEFGLPLKEKTLPQQLKSLGYTTGMFGKWHLGHDKPYRPQSRGFDEFVGFLGGAHSYLDIPGADGSNQITRGETPVVGEQYATDLFAREAARFVDKHKDKPFFLYLSFNAVHTPLEATPKYLERFKDIKDPRRQTYAAMQSAMDDGIGRVLERVRANGLDQKTLIFFISDNGGPTRANTSRNDPLNGFKGQVLEGGIRVPFIARWTDRLPAGKVYEKPVIALDIMATALAVAGDEKAIADLKLDGVNLMPFITKNGKGRPHENLFWRMGDQWAIRQGDWKLLKLRGEQPKLFNLKDDISEKKNLISEKPDVAARLQKAYDEWDSQLKQPAWAVKGGTRPRQRERDRATTEPRPRQASRRATGGQN